MFGRRASQHLQRLRWMEGRHGFRTGPRQLLSRCLFVLGRLRHCLPLLETNTNCTLAPGLEMCSWGHVAKNSNACSHEWRAHSTIALVFNTKAWHGQKKKRSFSGHSHKCQGGVQSGINTGAGELQAAPEASPTFGPTYWTVVICLNTLQENVTWKQPGACHGVLCLLVARQHSFHPNFTFRQ